MCMKDSKLIIKQEKTYIIQSECGQTTQTSINRNCMHFILLISLIIIQLVSDDFFSSFIFSSHDDLSSSEYPDGLPDPGVENFQYNPISMFLRNPHESLSIATHSFRITIDSNAEISLCIFLTFVLFFSFPQITPHIVCRYIVLQTGSSLRVHHRYSATGS